MIAKLIKENVVDAGKIPVYIGRFCPIHNGHEAIMRGILEASPDNHIVFVGSCNQPISYRNIFTFEDRIDFIDQVTGGQLITAGLPDFKNDNKSWFLSLDKLIQLGGYLPKEIVFIGGCREDIEWFEENKRATLVVNRFEGFTQNISGTEIRDSLITGNTKRLNTLINPKIVDVVLERFNQRWSEFKRT